MSKYPFNTDFNPYQVEQFGVGQQTPYVEGVNNYMPQPLPTGINEEQLYPLEYSMGTPQFNNTAMQDNQPMMEYRKGGKVKKKRNSRFTANNPYPTLAEIIRQQGQGEDTILAHINPLEARILGLMSGNDTLNPVTGLPQFFFKGVKHFFKNPGKTIGKTFKNPKRTIADAIGTATAIFGGPLVAAIGGGLRSAVRGDGENPLIGALKGAGYGVAIPAAAGMIGAGLSNIGATGAGEGLKNYATSNMGSWVGNMGQVGKGVSGLTNSLSSAISGKARVPIEANGVPTEWAKNNLGEWVKAPVNAEQPDFLTKLSYNSKDFLAKPSNLMSTAAFALPLLNKPKAPREKSPEEKADEVKRYGKAVRLSPQEMGEMKAYQNSLRNGSNMENFRPTEQINFSPKYRRQHSPEEYDRTRRWFSYYDNPDFNGEPIAYAEGGHVDEGGSLFANMLLDSQTEPQEIFEYAEIGHPKGLATYIRGDTGGQDDQIPVRLPNGAYVFDSSTLADVGDGNNAAGAKKLDEFFTREVRKQRSGKTTLPPRAKKIEGYFNDVQNDLVPALVSDGEYFLRPNRVTDVGDGNNAAGARKIDKFVKEIRKHKRGGKTTLPPRAKPLATYMAR